MAAFVLETQYLTESSICRTEILQQSSHYHAVQCYFIFFEWSCGQYLENWDIL